jgi:hypothetical protein
MAEVHNGCSSIGSSRGHGVAPTGPRCQHLQLLKLQGEPVDVSQVSKAQEAVSDLLANLSRDTSLSALPDLRSLRLSHPTKFRDHAKGLCECAPANSLLPRCLCCKLCPALCSAKEDIDLQASRNIFRRCKARRRGKYDARSISHGSRRQVDSCMF